MLHNEARELLVAGYEKTHDAQLIADAYSVSKRTVYRLEQGALPVFADKKMLKNPEGIAVIVKLPVAMKQIIADQARKSEAPPQPENGPGGTRGADATSPADWSSTATPPAPAPEKPKNTRFFLSKPLNTTRIHQEAKHYRSQIPSLRNPYVF